MAALHLPRHAPLARPRRAPGRTFAWASPTAKAWAPEAAYRDGEYFFYAPVGGDRIGVAVSDRPDGGFRDARGTPLIDKARDANAGAEPIDPCVLVDGDGRAWLVFGTRKPKVVELARDMIHTRGLIRDVELRGLPKGMGYGEAPFLHAHGGRFYFSFSTGWPGQIAYATAASPTCPFTYRGVVVDYRRLSTNHHAIVDQGGRSWVFYHDRLAPGGGDYRRSITYAPLTYAPDGTMRADVPPSPPASSSSQAFRSRTPLISGRATALRTSRRPRREW